MGPALCVWPKMLPISGRNSGSDSERVERKRTAALRGDITRRVAYSPTSRQNVFCSLSISSTVILMFLSPLVRISMLLASLTLCVTRNGCPSAVWAVTLTLVLRRLWRMLRVVSGLSVNVRSNFFGFLVCCLPLRALKRWSTALVNLNLLYMFSKLRRPSMLRAA